MKYKKFIFKYERFILYGFIIGTLLSFIILSNKIYRKGKNNRLINTGGKLAGVKINFRGSNNTVIVGKLTRIANTEFTIIGNNSRIILGDRYTIRNSEFWTEDNNSTIFISDKVRMNGCHLAATEGKSISIGYDCLFSQGIDIRTGDSHSIIINGTRERINHAKDVVFNEHIWVGKGATILKGVVVSSNSIIAAGSIVTKYVPSNSLVAGNPAVVIKTDIDWLIERV